MALDPVISEGWPGSAALPQHIAESLRLSGSRALFLPRLRLGWSSRNRCKIFSIDACDTIVSSRQMHTISRDSPCYYLTAVAKNRLPVFRSDKIKSVACSALNEARRSGKFSRYAYVVTTDGRVFAAVMGTYYLMSHS